MRRPRRATRSIAALAFVAASVSHAASRQTLRVDVALVTVVATVTADNGRYVGGLTEKDFIVADNGVPQEIVYFSQDQDIPVSLGILLDTSASMSNRMRTALAAIDRFIQTLDPDDDVFLATFSDRVRLVEDLTRDRNRISKALDDIRGSGGTALYDGLAMAVGKVAEGSHDKRAILLVTDGADIRSRIGLGEVLARLESAEVLVYALGIEPVQSDPSDHVRFNWPVTPIPGATALPRMRALDQPVDMAVLQRFAAASGGRAHRVSGTWTDGTMDDVDRVLDEVAAELRSQYTLAYYPSPATGGDGLHRIEVRVGNSGWTVRARDGYRMR